VSGIRTSELEGAAREVVDNCPDTAATTVDHGLAVGVTIF